MVIAVGLCRGDHLEPLGGRAGAEGVEELLCRGSLGEFAPVLLQLQLRGRER